MIVFEAPTATGPIPFALGVPALGLTVVPVLPVVPVDPVVPVLPVIPVLPVDPVVPVVPVDPVLAVLPVDPVLPVDVVTVGVMLWPGIFSQDDKTTVKPIKLITSKVLSRKVTFIYYCDGCLF
jgi:hypothetical protein